MTSPGRPRAGARHTARGGSGGRRGGPARKNPRVGAGGTSRTPAPVSWWLVEVRDALGFLLVLQHVGVPALHAVIDAEGVAGENAAPVRIGVEVLERFAAAVIRALGIDGAFVAVGGARVIPPADRGVDRRIADLDEAENIFGRRGLPRDDVRIGQPHQKRGAGGGGEEHDVNLEGDAAVGGETGESAGVDGGSGARRSRRKIKRKEKEAAPQRRAPPC